MKTPQSHFLKHISLYEDCLKNVKVLQVTELKAVLHVRGQNHILHGRNFFELCDFTDLMVLSDSFNVDYEYIKKALKAINNRLSDFSFAVSALNKETLDLLIKYDETNDQETKELIKLTVYPNETPTNCIFTGANAS